MSEIPRTPGKQEREHIPKDSPENETEMLQEERNTAIKVELLYFIKQTKQKK